MTRTQDIGRIRQLLQRRRRDLLQTSQAAHGEMSALQAAERDPELEENAQMELADYTLSSLLESQRREIVLIDAALARMDQQVFGQCVDCGQEIPYERLEALPFAIRCEECATEHERLHSGPSTVTTPSL